MRRAWHLPGKAAQCGLPGRSRLATGLVVTACVALQLRRASVSCSGRTRWPGRTWRHTCSSGIVLASLRQEIPSVLPQGPVSRRRPDVYACGEGRHRRGTRCAGSGCIHAGPSCAQRPGCRSHGLPAPRGSRQPGPGDECVASGSQRDPVQESPRRAWGAVQHPRAGGGARGLRVGPEPQSQPVGKSKPFSRAWVGRKWRGGLGVGPRWVRARHQVVPVHR